MRIISKFHDYYDAVMKTGMDREVVYVRENKEIVLDNDYGINFTTRESGNHYEVKLVLLGYCGQILKLYDVKCSIFEQERPFYRYDHREVFHDYDSFKSFMRENGFGSAYDFDKNRFWPGRYFRFNDLDTSKLNDIFHKYQTPLFTISHVHKWRSPGETILTLGPSLKDLDFHRVKDTYTTYQDIFQYVAGVLNKPETKMVKISDKDKIHKHGFDKWSFRQKGPKK